MSQSIRITIVGGEGLFQDALAESLARQPDFRVTGVFPSLEKALPLFRITQATVLLLAMDFDERTGAAAAAQARAAGFRGGVLIVTSAMGDGKEAQPQRDRAGVFPRSRSAIMLHQRIREIADGRSARTAPLSVSAASEQLVFPELTPREADVLLGVFRGCSNKEIAATLGISGNTVKTFLHQLFQKTGAQTRSQLVRIVIERYWGPQKPAVAAASEPPYFKPSASGTSSSIVLT
jgi:DNA-binding NarL/FixJ family response regulator